MAQNRSKTGRSKTQFKPGQSGNPAGRPPLPEDIKIARQLNRIELERLINELLNLGHSELAARLKRKDCPRIETIIAKIVKRAEKSAGLGDTSFLIDQLVGPPKQKLELSGTVGLADRLAKARERTKGSK